MEGVSGRSLADTADIIDDHFHNYENIFGLAAAPSSSHFGDLESLNPFVITSGNNVFGAAVGLIGTADTPVRVGSLLFDTRRLYIIDVSNANPFLVRIIWGTPAQTPAQAITAKQYSDTVAQQLTAAGNNKPQECFNIRIKIGDQVWAETKNGTNLSTVRFLVGMHEYPSPTF